MSIATVGPLTIEMAQCSKCGQEKPLGAFYLRTPGKPRRDCKECVKSRIQASPSATSRRKAAAVRRANRVPFDPVKYKAAWYQQNKDRLIAQNKIWASENVDKMRAFRRAWAKANPQKGRDSSNRYRARKMSRAFLITQKDWLRLVARYNGLCAYCQKAPYEHQDHVIPIARGGQHSIGNVLPSCESCNKSKSASTFMEWQRRISC